MAGARALVAELEAQAARVGLQPGVLQRPLQHPGVGAEQLQGLLGLGADRGADLLRVAEVEADLDAAEGGRRELDVDPVERRRGRPWRCAPTPGRPRGGAGRAKGRGAIRSGARPAGRRRCRRTPALVRRAWLSRPVAGGSGSAGGRAAACARRSGAEGGGGCRRCRGSVRSPRRRRRPRPCRCAGPAGLPDAARPARTRRLRLRRVAGAPAREAVAAGDAFFGSGATARTSGSAAAPRPARPASAAATATAFAGGGGRRRGAASARDMHLACRRPAPWPARRPAPRAAAPLAARLRRPGAAAGAGGRAVAAARLWQRRGRRRRPAWRPAPSNAAAAAPAEAEAAMPASCGDGRQVDVVAALDRLRLALGRRRGRLRRRSSPAGAVAGAVAAAGAPVSAWISAGEDRAVGAGLRRAVGCCGLSGRAGCGGRDGLHRASGPCRSPSASPAPHPRRLVKSLQSNGCLAAGPPLSTGAPDGAAASSSEAPLHILPRRRSRRFWRHIPANIGRNKSFDLLAGTSIKAAAVPAPERGLFLQP